MAEDWDAIDEAAIALSDALDMIGAPDMTDHDLAKVIVENEVGLMKLVNWALRESTKAAHVASVNS